MLSEDDEEDFESRTDEDSPTKSDAMVIKLRDGKRVGLSMAHEMASKAPGLDSPFRWAFRLVGTGPRWAPPLCSRRGREPVHPEDEDNDRASSTNEAADVSASDNGSSKASHDFSRRKLVAMAAGASLSCGEQSIHDQRRL